MNQILERIAGDRHLRVKRYVAVSNLVECVEYSSDVAREVSHHGVYLDQRKADLVHRRSVSTCSLAHPDRGQCLCSTRCWIAVLVPLY